MEQGWIKLYRQILDSVVWSDAKLYQVWSWCLLRAAHKPSSFPMNGRSMRIFPGQLVTGRYKGAAECNMSPTTWYRKIKRLEELDMIVVHSTTQFTKIEIVKWQQYQVGFGQPDGQRGEQQKKSSKGKKHKGSKKKKKESWTTNGQQMDTYKNEKNDNKGLVPEDLSILEGPQPGVDPGNISLNEGWTSNEEDLNLSLSLTKLDDENL